MSYIIHCISCNGNSELHDNLMVGQCPKCGVAIVPIAREDNTIICDKHRFLPIIQKAMKRYKSKSRTI